MTITINGIPVSLQSLLKKNKIEKRPLKIRISGNNVKHFNILSGSAKEYWTDIIKKIYKKVKSREFSWRDVISKDVTKSTLMRLAHSGVIYKTEKNQRWKINSAIIEKLKLNNV